MQNSCEPKVSVITVVYNDVKNIENTIVDTLTQDYQNLEYIVVDGASTDGTLDIIKKYEGRLVWHSEKDNGIYHAMNKGIALAHGEWILFRNSGDFFFDKKVLKNVFEHYEDNGEWIITGSIRFFNKFGTLDLKPNYPNKDKFYAMPFFHPSTLIRTSIQRKFLYNLSYHNSSDYNFFIELINAGLKYLVSDLIISCFEQESGTSTVNYGLSLEENIQILKKHKAPISFLMTMYYRLFKWNVNKVLCKNSVYKIVFCKSKTK